MQHQQPVPLWAQIKALNSELQELKFDDNFPSKINKLVNDIAIVKKCLQDTQAFNPNQNVKEEARHALAILCYQVSKFYRAVAIFYLEKFEKHYQGMIDATQIARKKKPCIDDTDEHYDNTYYQFYAACLRFKEFSDELDFWCQGVKNFPQNISDDSRFIIEIEEIRKQLLKHYEQYELTKKNHNEEMLQTENLPKAEDPKESKALQKRYKQGEGPVTFDVLRTTILRRMDKLDLWNARDIVRQFYRLPPETQLTILDEIHTKLRTKFKKAKSKSKLIALGEEIERYIAETIQHMQVAIKEQQDKLQQLIAFQAETAPLLIEAQSLLEYQGTCSNKFFSDNHPEAMAQKYDAIISDRVKEAQQKAEYKDVDGVTIKIMVLKNILQEAKNQHSRQGLDEHKMRAVFYIYYELKKIDTELLEGIQRLKNLMETPSNFEAQFRHVFPKSLFNASPVPGKKQGKKRSRTPEDEIQEDGVAQKPNKEPKRKKQRTTAAERERKQLEIDINPKHKPVLSSQSPRFFDSRVSSPGVSSESGDEPNEETTASNSNGSSTNQDPVSMEESGSSSRKPPVQAETQPQQPEQKHQQPQQQPQQQQQQMQAAPVYGYPMHMMYGPPQGMMVYHPPMIMVQPGQPPMMMAYPGHPPMVMVPQQQSTQQMAVPPGFVLCQVGMWGPGNGQQTQPQPQPGNTGFQFR